MRSVSWSLRLAQRTGRLPQNVNFAISGATARAFLDTHEIAHKGLDLNRDTIHRRHMTKGQRAVAIRRAGRQGTDDVD